MGTITAATIISDVATTLFDTNNAKWSRAELLAWLNQAQRQIVTLKPSANSVRASVQFTAGAVQTLPAGGWLVLDVGWTMGDDGTTPGHAMRQVSRTLIDDFDTDYPIAAQVEEPTEWWFDQQEPTTWYVNPPADGVGYTNLVYSKLPTVISSEATAIDLNDAYEPAITSFILYKACSKKVEFAAGAHSPSDYWQLFTQQVQFKGAAEVTNNPNLTLAARQPGVQGVNS